MSFGSVGHGDTRSTPMRERPHALPPWAWREAAATPWSAMHKGAGAGTTDSVSLGGVQLTP